jgi:hypothetical protein
MLWRVCHPAADDGGGLPAHIHTPSTITSPLSARTLAPIMTRSLLRSYLPQPRRGPPPPDPPEAVALVRALIDDYPLVFHALREEEGRTALALQSKIHRLAEVVDGTRAPAAVDDPDCAHLFRRLFAFLARVERRIQRACHVTASPSTALLEGVGDVTPPRRGHGSARGRRRERERPTRANSASPRLRSPTASLAEQPHHDRHEHERRRHRGGTRSEAGSPSRGSGWGHERGHSAHERDEGEDEEEREEDDEEEEDEAGGEPFSFISPRWEVRDWFCV